MEFALIVPVLALLMVGLIDLGRVFYTYVAVTNAAREGARYCVLHPGATAPQLAARVSGNGIVGSGTGELDGRVVATVTAWAAPAGATPISTSPQCPIPGASDDVTVQVAANFQPITPLLSNITGGTIAVRSAATMAPPPLSAS